MKGNYVKFTDNVQFSFLDSSFTNIKDQLIPMAGSAPGTQQTRGVSARIAATHAGIITRNKGFYLPDKMKSGVSSWTQDYTKPVLVHHNEKADSIGRVVEAQYVDTAGAVITQYNGLAAKNSKGKEFGTINEALIKDFCDGRMPYSQQVDVIKNILDNAILRDDSYEGLGHIEIVANVTDPDAIQKLLDGRYLTGSVGATTDKAVCSICRKDWAQDEGPCDHKPGGIYDGAECFLIAGKLIYDEYSFVNAPADKYSRVIQVFHGGVRDSIEITHESGKIYDARLSITDFVLEDPMTKKVEAEKVEAKDATLKVKDVATDPAKTLETPVKVETEEPVVTPEVKDEIKEETQDDFLTRVFTSEKLVDADREKLYELQWKEVDGAFVNGKSIDSDKKLTPEARKKLVKSAFCGPDKALPLNDITHVVAARRLVSKYKGTADVAPILAVIDRKAKVLGVGLKKEDQLEPKDNIAPSRIMHQVLGVLEEEYWAAQGGKAPLLSDDEKSALRNILKRLAGLVGKDEFLYAAVAQDLAQNEQTLLDEVAKLETEVGDLKDRLDATQKEYHFLYDDMQSIQDSQIKIREETRKAKEAHLTLLTNLKDSKVEDRDFTSLSEADLDSRLTEAVKIVDVAKITAKLDNGMSRNPQGTVDNPTKIVDNTQKKEVPEQVMAKIASDYMKIKQHVSEEAAEAFRQMMVRRGYIQATDSN